MLVYEEKDGENGMVKFEILSNAGERFYYIGGRIESCCV